MHSLLRTVLLVGLTVSSACAGSAGRPQTLEAWGGEPAAGYPTEPNGMAVMRFAFEEGDLFGCYTSLLRATDEKGKMVLQFSILPDGRVEGAQVLESTFGGEETSACVVDRVSRWNTPFRPSKRKIFRVPVTFD